jgi:hypothetical protein
MLLTLGHKRKLFTARRQKFFPLVKQQKEIAKVFWGAFKPCSFYQ